MDKEKLNETELTEKEAEEVDGGRGYPVGRCPIREDDRVKICDAPLPGGCLDCPKNPDIRN